MKKTSCRYYWQSITAAILFYGSQTACPTHVKIFIKHPFKKIGVLLKVTQFMKNSRKKMEKLKQFNEKLKKS